MLIKYYGSGQFLLVISFTANNFFFFYEFPPSQMKFHSIGNLYVLNSNGFRSIAIKMHLFILIIHLLPDQYIYFF